ncbi:MAG: hypothetical protein ACJ74T_21165 [Pyrinomonadaceae bacterium]
MKVVRTFFLYTCMALALAGTARAQEWRAIVPLQSTRADVERLLGPAADSYGVVYELKAGNLSVEYSTGFCAGEKQQGWNVPEDVVISYLFSPKVKQRPADLRLDPKKFRKVKDEHVGGDYYVNAEDGITYAIQGGVVDYVEYYPAARFRHLVCGDASAAAPLRLTYEMWPQNIEPTESKLEDRKYERKPRARWQRPGHRRSSVGRG